MPAVYIQKSEDLVTLIQNNPQCLIVVDFYADWCGPCKMIGEKFDKIWLPKYGNKLILAKVDSDNDNLSSLCNQYQVRGIPRLIFYKNMQKIDDITGANSTVIEQLCETHCK